MHALGNYQLLEPAMPLVGKKGGTGRPQNLAALFHIILVSRSVRTSALGTEDVVGL